MEICPSLGPSERTIRIVHMKRVRAQQHEVDRATQGAARDRFSIIYDSQLEHRIFPVGRDLMQCIRFDRELRDWLERGRRRCAPRALELAAMRAPGDHRCRSNGGEYRPRFQDVLILRWSGSKLRTRLPRAASTRTPGF